MKGYFSNVLMTVADAEGMFIAIGASDMWYEQQTYYPVVDEAFPLLP